MSGHSLTGAVPKKTRRGRTFSRRDSSRALPVLGSLSGKAASCIALADAGRDDWILCQVTSNPYGDSRAVRLTVSSFDSGSLRADSYARPGKLFTASRELMVAEVAILNTQAHVELVDAVIRILRD